jgi:hypothetical protein
MKINNSKYFYSFIITCLMVGIGLFGVVIYFKTRPPEHNPFIERILENGGGVITSTNDISYIEATISVNTEYVFSELKPKRYTPDDIKNIVALGICNISVTADDFKNLGQLKKLRDVTFNDAKLYGNIFGHIENPHISNLGITQSQLEGSVDNLLSNLPIKNLVFAGINFPDSFFKNQKTSTRPTIDYFFCIASNLSDDITYFFNECPSLRSVVIFDGDIECTFIRDMKHTDSIEEISINNMNLNDDMLPFFLRFKNLKDISIMNCEVTEKSRPIFEELAKRVQTVYIGYQGERIFYSVYGEIME